MAITGDNSFRYQSTQRNFCKQPVLSCCLCSNPPRPPLGSGLAWPEYWPSGQCPSPWNWSWDRGSCQRQHARQSQGQPVTAHKERPGFQYKQKPEGPGQSQDQGVGARSSERVRSQGWGGGGHLSGPTGVCGQQGGACETGLRKGPVTGWTASASWHISCSAPFR